VVDADGEEVVLRFNGLRLVEHELLPSRVFRRGPALSTGYDFLQGISQRDLHALLNLPRDTRYPELESVSRHENAVVGINTFTSDKIYASFLCKGINLILLKIRPNGSNPKNGCFKKRYGVY